MTHRPVAPSRALALAGLLLLGAASFPAALAQPAPGGPQSQLAADITEAAARPPLVVGKAVAVALSRGEAAYFSLPDRTGEVVALTRRLSRGIDTVMALVDSQGRVLDEDDDGGEENLASRIEIGADQAGPLFLRVALLEQGGGQFELVLEEVPPPDPGAPARSLAEAVTRPELPLGQGVAIRLRGRQEAWFRLPAGRQDLVVLTRALGPGTDTVLALHDANGREIVEDDDGGEERLASRIEVPAGQRRPLFLRARSLTGGGSFEVALLPDTAPPAPAFPASLRAAAAAAPLALGQPVPLVLRRGQAAFFRLPEGDIAVLTRDLRRGADTVLALIDAEGQEVASDDDGGGGLASRLEVAGTQARPLFVRATLLGDATGAFDLVVEADTPPAVTLPQSTEEARGAPALERNVAVPIRLRRGQVAVFLLPPGPGVVATRNLREGSDTVLEILDEAGRVLAEDDDGGEGLASRLAVDGAGKGDLFVRASLLGSGSGAFDLILLPPGGR